MRNLLRKEFWIVVVIMFTITIIFFLKDGAWEDMKLETLKDEEVIETKFYYQNNENDSNDKLMLFMTSLRDTSRWLNYYRDSTLSVNVTQWHRSPIVFAPYKDAGHDKWGVIAYTEDKKFAIIQSGILDINSPVDDRKMFYIHTKYLHDSPRGSQNEVHTDVKTYETKDVIHNEPTFEETQDSLRKVLLSSKPNENLKSSLLQELYIRGLVNQKGDNISFILPFNLHGLDCGAPDCYSTDITFNIPSTEPIKFPNKTNFDLHEYGCVDQEKAISSVFNLEESTNEFVNYYSEELKSNLIIKKNGGLYYYPHLKTSSVSVEIIESMFENYNFDDAEITPYQSTVMTSNEYEYFIQN